MLIQMIENELLVKLAQDFGQRLGMQQASVEAACLVGSVARKEPPLNNAIDINIIGIDTHATPDAKPQHVYQSDTVLISYLPVAKDRMRDKKALRRDPFLGPALYEGVPLFDPRHQFDLVQAAIRSNFFSSDNVYQRARAAYNKAQQAFTPLKQHASIAPIELFSAKELLSLNRIFDYAMTALMMLARIPASGRRQMIQFEHATRELGVEALYNEFCLGLGYEQFASVTTELIELWQQVRTSYVTQQEMNAPDRASALAAQTGYYQVGAETLNEYGYSRAALLCLEASLAKMMLDVESPIADAAYTVWLSKTGKGDPAACQRRVQLAQHVLTKTDEALRAWAMNEGVSVYG